MTLEELKAKYTVAYRIIARERARRDVDYAGDLEQLLVVLDDMKDALKEYIGSAPEQATLLDVVREVKYT